MGGEIEKEFLEGRFLAPYWSERVEFLTGLRNQARHFLAKSLVQFRRIALCARPELVAAPTALIDFFAQWKPSTSSKARDF